MHWDTCPQRGRNRPRDLATHWRREAERLKVENGKLQTDSNLLRAQLTAQQTARQASASDPEIMALAHIVGELQRLDEAERGRTLRYLNHRYAPSGEPVTRVGGLVRGPVMMNTPGGPPPLGGM